MSPDEATKQAVAMLAGQMHGVVMVIQALAGSHPAPHALLAELDQVEQPGLANIEGEPVPDSTIESYQFVLAAVRQVAEAKAALSM